MILMVMTSYVKADLILNERGFDDAKHISLI